MAIPRNLSNLANGVDTSGTLAVAKGGTGQTTATAAFNALAPSQTSNAGKYLTTDGTNTSWGSVASQVYPSAGIAVSTGTAWDTSKTSPSGNIVGTTDTQTLTNKTISGANNTITVDGTNPIGYKNIPPVGTKTNSYTLTTSDVGKYVQVGSGGSITIPDSVFAEGDAVSIFNNTTGTITITCTITTAYIAGADADKASVTLATRGVANILFISGTVCVITGNVS